MMWKWCYGIIIIFDIFIICIITFFEVLMIDYKVISFHCSQIAESLSLIFPSPLCLSSTHSRACFTAVAAAKKTCRRSSEEDMNTNTTGDLQKLCDSDCSIWFTGFSNFFFFPQRPSSRFLWVFHMSISCSIHRKPLFWKSYTVKASRIGSLTYSNSLLRVGGWLSH